MKKVKLGKHDITLYNAIDELPMVRFHRYNKMLLLDAGLGSDLAAVDGHIERAVRFIKNDKRTEAAGEMENLRQNIYFIQQGLSPKHLAFAVLVTEVDGQPCDDVSDEGLQRVVKMLEDVPVKEVAQEMDATKKKIDDELILYFPEDFDDASEKEYFDIMRRRTEAMLDEIINGAGEEIQQRIDRLTDELVCFTKPKCFTGKESAEIEYDKRFEDMCLIMSEKLHNDPKKFTVMEYYNAYRYIKTSIKRQRQHLKAR